jgi:hypothetical protein
MREERDASERASKNARKSLLRNTEKPGPVLKAIETDAIEMTAEGEVSYISPSKNRNTVTDS